MKIIKSKDNARYKAALKLKSRKYRDETGLYLLEGIKPLKDALEYGTQPEAVFIEEGSGAGMIPDDRAFGITRELFAQLSDTENSQGVISVFRQQPSGEERLAQILDGDGHILILDRIQDPGNMGTMIRTAEAAGYGGVVLLKGCTDVYSPKVVRSAAGSVMRVPIVSRADEDKLISLSGSTGRKLVVTALEGAMDYREARYPERSLLVIGNEGKGVSEGLMKAADVKIKIPMAGAIESLNAAVAAGILMYESQNIKSM
ncbi:MAG: RNA methyltransferase [Firmicutes bacterium]|nr:RNA methyltransferase [Bacillota bacterium]